MYKRWKNKEEYLLGIGTPHEYLDILNVIFDDDLFSFLNEYSIELNYYELDIFLNARDNIIFFKQSHFSQNLVVFNRQIEQLKKNANRQQFFSESQIEIRLPQLPHVTLSFMVESYKKTTMHEDTIRDLYSYFGKKQLPKKDTKAIQQAKNKYNKTLSGIENYNNKTLYCKPPITQSFHHQTFLSL